MTNKTTEAPAELWDVIAVNIKSGEHRIMETGKTHRNAEATMNMAIMRRGLDTEFYKLLPHGGDDADA